MKYCGDILPVLSTIVMNFTKSTPILERVCRCWRYMIISYRNAMAPLLPTLAQNISSGFEASREGCFLWATDAIVREFSTGAELVDNPTSVAVYQFFEQQVVLFLRILNDLPPEQLPDSMYNPSSGSLSLMLIYVVSDRGLLQTSNRCSQILPQEHRHVKSLCPHFLCCSECTHPPADRTFNRHPTVSP